MKNKLTSLFTLLFVLFAVFSAFFGAPGETGDSIYDSIVATQAADTIQVDDSKDAVAAYIHAYGSLPNFYMTKDEAEASYGWEGGPLDALAPGMAIGGDRFGNYENILPATQDRIYWECDIDTIGADDRGAKRIVFSNDGLVYYTEDHYESFERLYGDP